MEYVPTRNELIDAKCSQKKYIRAKGHGNPYFIKSVAIKHLQKIEEKIEPLIL